MVTQSNFAKAYTEFSVLNDLTTVFFTQGVIILIEPRRNLIIYVVEQGTE